MQTIRYPRVFSLTHYFYLIHYLAKDHGYDKNLFRLQLSHQPHEQKTNWLLSNIMLHLRALDQNPEEVKHG